MTPLLTLLAGLAPQPLAAPLPGDAVVVQATMVHTADAAIENGRVVIRDGRIEAVGPDVFFRCVTCTYELRVRVALLFGPRLWSLPIGQHDGRVQSGDLGPGPVLLPYKG